MFDLTSTAFWAAIRKDLWEAITYPGIEIQLYLAVLAILVALMSSILIQRMVSRRITSESKHAWVAEHLLPALLFPVLMLFALVIAGWAARVTLPFKVHTSDGFIEIAAVWVVARALLLIAQRHFIAYFVSGVILVLALLSVTNLLAPAQASLSEIKFDTSSFHISLLGAIKGSFTLIILFWGAGVFSKNGEAWIRKLNISFNARELAVKFLNISLYFLAFVLTLNEMGVDLTALTVFGGALAVGLGFGLQKITSNFISGIILLFEKTIETGDLIEVSGERGWVRQMAIRHTLIETPDGREILIPNEDLITGKVTNWTYTNTRARIDILLTVEYNSVPDIIRPLLLTAAKEHPKCIKTPGPECYLREFNERGIQFQLVFWIPDVKDGMSAVKSDVMLSIIRAFSKNNIIFAKA